jgi:Uma2 family endonuclease
MEGMTVTESPPVRPASALERADSEAPWSIDDLGDLPEGNRYEIFNGSLLVSPTPNVAHCRTTTALDHLLYRQAPPHLWISSAGFGIRVRGGMSYLVPDVIVLRRSALDRPASRILPPDVLLVVEVLSPSNPSNDLVLKRHEYAVAGIPHYWIVDVEAETLSVLTLTSDGKGYAGPLVVRAGEPWKCEEPFPLVLDLAEIF